MQLGERLKVEIALYGLQPRDVAERSGLDKGYISRILAGKQTCPPATMRRLVDAIHADLLEPTRETRGELAEAAR